MILGRIQKTDGDVINKRQMALTQNAYVKCIKEVTRMNQNHHLVKIDIKKAFDSVPHCVIHRKLRELHIPDNIIKYIMNFV